MPTSVHGYWDLAAFPAADESLEAICAPYITAAGMGLLERLPYWRVRGLRVLTKLEAGSIAAGVLDPSALRALMAGGAEIRHLPCLHAKMYLAIGSGAVFVGSANVTQSAMHLNREVMLRIDEAATASSVRGLFERYWQEAVSVDEHFLRREEQAAANLREVPLEADDRLLLAWGQRFVLLEVRAIVLEKLEDLDLPADLLGFKREITEEIRRASRVKVRTLGRELRKVVEEGARKEKGVALSLLQEGRPRARKMLPLVELASFDQACQAWEKRLQILIGQRIRDSYALVRQDAWENCQKTLAHLGDKRARPFSQGEVERIQLWFASTFPRMEALVQDARVEVLYFGLHRLQFERDPGLRNEVTNRIRLPQQPRIPGLVEKR